MSNPLLLAALVPYASQRRFCLWRYASLRASNRKPTKMPFESLDRMARANNPDTWISYSDAVELWRTCGEPTGKAGGIGIFLGDGLAGIDLDSCIGPLGLERWAADILPLLGGAIEVSPSGTGMKAYLTYDVGNEATLLDVLGLDPTKGGGTLWKESGSDDHPRGIELYFKNRFFALTGEVVS
jgi:hypothetical protein